MTASILSDPQFHNEAAAFAFVEARLWPNGPVCHHCKSGARVGALQGKTTRPGLYKCYACRKPFTVRMGTVFESSHIEMHKWLQGIYLLCSSKKGISINQLHRTLRISLKSAWFMSHRIREAMSSLGMEPMGGAGGVLNSSVNGAALIAWKSGSAPSPSIKICMGSCLIAYLISAALCTQGANAQTKASVLLAHCAVGAHGDDFCRGFVEATVDEIAFFPDERESAHSCFFTDDQLKASTDRLVDIARTALYAMPEPSRYSHNAAVVIRDYFDSHALCKTIKP